MKKVKSGIKAVALSVAALALAACGSQSATSTTAKVTTEVKEATTITFWHAMNGAHENALIKLTEDFMKANPNVKVELQNQSSYKDLQAKLNATFTSKQNLPTISQAYPGWLVDAAASDLLVDLNPYTSNEKIGFKSGEAPLEALMKGAQIDGKQYGMPFNKSTEVLFYNKTLLDQYGVPVPKTLEELKTASQTIYEKSNGAVVGAGFDSLNNYYAIGMKNEGVDFNNSLDFASDKSKQVVNYYADGVKAGYFRIAGSDKFLSGPFSNQTLAMYVGSTAGESFVAKGASDKGFTYGVAPRPEKVNLQQGTDVYMFSSATETQRTAAYLYMKYLVSADSQLYWAQQTGYMPALESVLKSDAYKNSTSKVPAVLEATTKELYSIPVVQNADAAYTELRTIMENILATGKADFSALKTQLSQVWSK